MAVVLRQRAHARQAGQLAGLLVAVERGELGEAQRQLAVGVPAHLVEERHVAGAVHRLQAEGDVLIHHRREHDVLVVVVVARALVQVFLDHVPRPDVLVAVAGLRLADVAFHQVAQHLALGGEERQARADVIGEVEQAELLAQLAVVALLGFFQPPQVILQLLWRCPRPCRRCAAASGAFRRRASRRRPRSSA